jgi:hypothetical protein
MPVSLLGKKCGVAGQTVVVPQEQFLRVISNKTHLSEQELKTMTAGQIEDKLELRAVKPVQLSSLKQGKSNSDLYEFKGYETRKNPL